MSTMLDSCRALPQCDYKAGDEVLHEGHSTGHLYVLVEGKVEICKGDVQVSRVSEPGATFGEMSVLLHQPHMATVKCLTDCKFLIAEDARRFLDAHPEVTIIVAEMLARRLGSLTRYLVDIKHQFEDQKDHLSMVDEVLESLLHHQGKVKRPQA
jgi:CRP/FNR family transcriptional regulator, cyclic AMP receptor protein